MLYLSGLSLWLLFFPAVSKAHDDGMGKMVFDTGFVQGKATMICAFYKAGVLQRDQAKRYLRMTIEGFNKSVDPTGGVGNTVMKNVLRALPSCGSAWQAY